MRQGDLPPCLLTTAKAEGVTRSKRIIRRTQRGGRDL